MFNLSLFFYFHLPCLPGFDLACTHIGYLFGFSQGFSQPYPVPVSAIKGTKSLSTNRNLAFF
jgi:hypothetical protein